MNNEATRRGQSLLGLKQHKMPVVEIFGPTIQGEGILIGRQTHFLRLGGCDYRCIWCDSLHAVMPDEVRRNSVYMNSEEIVHELKNRRHAPYVTISGGNPAIQKLGPLVKLLREAGFKSAIETQGTKLPYWMSDVDIVTVSPKPPSSQMQTDWELLDAYMKIGQSHLKIVVFDEQDYLYAKNVRAMYPNKLMFLSVGNLVGSDGNDALISKLKWLTEKVLTDPEMYDVIPLPQLHVLLWGNAKGV